MGEEHIKIETPFIRLDALLKFAGARSEEHTSELQSH